MRYARSCGSDMSESSLRTLRAMGLALLACVFLAGRLGRGEAAVPRSGSSGVPYTFNFQRELFGTPPTLSLTLLSVDPGTGDVLLGGGDTAQPTLPFTFDWGDGTTTDAFFNQQHTYSDATKNYVISVTAHYAVSDSDTQEIAVWFVPPALDKQSFPAGLAVTIPNQTTTLTSTCCYPPPSLCSSTTRSSLQRTCNLTWNMSSRRSQASSSLL